METHLNFHIGLEIKAIIKKRREKSGLGLYENAIESCKEGFSPST
jgi:hypothetical protein